MEDSDKLQAPSLLIPNWKYPRWPLNMKLGVTHRRFGRFGENMNIIPLLDIEAKFFAYPPNSPAPHRLCCPGNTIIVIACWVSRVEASPMQATPEIYKHALLRSYMFVSSVLQVNLI